MTTGEERGRVPQGLHSPPKDPHNSRGSRTDLLTEYIEAQMKVGELVKWTVVLVSKRAVSDSPEASHDFGGGLKVGLWERNNASGRCRDSTGSSRTT